MNFKQYIILMIVVPLLITSTYLLSKLKIFKKGMDKFPQKEGFPI